MWLPKPEHSNTGHRATVKGNAGDANRSTVACSRHRATGEGEHIRVATAGISGSNACPLTLKVMLGECAGIPWLSTVTASLIVATKTNASPDLPQLRTIGGGGVTDCEALHN